MKKKKLVARDFLQNRFFVKQKLERVRHHLADSVLTMAHGMRLENWLVLLREHRPEISWSRVPRMVFMTMMSVLHSVVGSLEDLWFGERVAAIQVEPPLFVLGHWRSGTTLLHNLFACDPQFAAPTLLQTLYPHSFLVLERPMRLFASLIPRTRVIDNIAFNFDQPQEDEFAICNTTQLSPYTGWIFPHSQGYYDRYLTLENVSPQELDLWKNSFLQFLRKVCLRTGRRLVLKSPTHTARIRLLLELFPDACFVHISRDPYTVFQSTKHLHQVMLRMTSLQRGTELDLDEFVLRRYELLYDNFFVEKQLIPPGRYCEVRFDELEREPLGTMERLYSELGLVGFARARPHLTRHIAGIGGYRKNRFPPLPPEVRDKISQRWRSIFEKWGHREQTSESQGTITP